MTWDEIKQQVEINGNVSTFTMATLREAHDSGRLGIHVRLQISNVLAGMGLGHVPQELPTYQHQQVRLYKRGTPVGELIEMALNPGEVNDKKLAEQVAEAGADYAAVIEKIRDLIAE